MKKVVKRIIATLVVIAIIAVSALLAWNSYNSKLVLLAPTSDGLVSYYSFNDTSLTTIFPDSVGGKNFFCVMGSTDADVPATKSTFRSEEYNKCPIYVEGKTGKAIQFDGVNDFIQIQGDNAFNTLSKGTIAFWVKTSDNKQDQTVFMASNLASDADYLEIRLNNAWTSYHGIMIHSRSSTGTNWLMYTDPAISYDWTQWTHIAIVQDGVNPALYINGQRKPEGAGGIKFSAGTNRGAWFDDIKGTNIVYLSGMFARASGTGNYFKGSLDELKIYNKALSDAEIEKCSGIVIPIKIYAQTTKPSYVIGEQIKLG